MPTQKDCNPLASLMARLPGLSAAMADRLLPEQVAATRNSALLQDGRKDAHVYQTCRGGPRQRGKGEQCDGAGILGSVPGGWAYRIPSLVREGPDIAIEALARTFDDVLALTGTAKSAVLAVGLDTPGPASAEGVISSSGSTNFSHPAWRSFDVRRALEDRLQLPVIYNNDGNAAALYAHQMHFGSAGGEHSSIAAIVGRVWAAVSSRPG
jgi:hypothetical protein